MHFLIRFLVRHRIASLIFCGLSFAFFASLATRCWLELRDYPLVPQRLTLAEVTSTDDARWVTLSDASGSCDDARTSAGSVLLPLTGPAVSNPAMVVAELRDACESNVGAPTGVLRPMPPEGVVAARGAGLAIPPDTRVYELLTFAGPSNARVGLYVCGALTLSSLGLHFMLERLRRRQRGVPADAATVP